MQFLDKIKEIIKELGWLHASGVSMVIAGITIPLSVPFPDRLKGYWAIALLPYAFVAIGIVLIIVGRIRDGRRKRDSLNVIAWEGIGDQDITQGFEQRHRKLQVNCLEYVRGVDKVSHLRLEERPFDILILDNEFIDNVDGAKLVEMNSQRFGHDLCQRIEAAGRSLPPGLQGQTKGLAIPIRCGLNAVLLNEVEAKRILRRSDLNLDSYNFLRPRNLKMYPTEPKIAIWNWYLPSLCIFLLAEGASPRSLFTQRYKKIRSIVDQLLDGRNIDRFLLYNDPRRLTEAMEGGKVWAVPAGGGWFLPLGLSRSHWKVVVPRKSHALLWMECASVLADADKEKATMYIEYLLEEETQLKICRRDSYRACPVRGDLLSKLPPDMIEASDKDRIFEDNLGRRENVIFRKLPGHPMEWEMAWSVLEKGAAYGG